MTLPFGADERAHEPLHDRAMDNVLFIRRTMERAGSFTAVSGAGIVGIGLVALPAAYAAQLQGNSERWVMAWVGAALVAVVIAVTMTARKATSLGLPLVSGPGRKFALAFTPAFVAGAVLTLALGPAAPRDQLVGMWLLLYGAGVTAGGAMSVPAVPVMGIAFMAAGAAALLAPASVANWFMAGGFGGLHLVFGAWIARKYGG